MCWQEPLLQLNPTFLPAGSVGDLVTQGVLHPECGKIFRIEKSATDHTGKALLLRTHQGEAILRASNRVLDVGLVSVAGGAAAALFAEETRERLLEEVSR